MLDKFIEEGKQLESAVKLSTYSGKMISGIEFETWAAKVILYLEKHHAESSLTEKAIEVNKRLGASSYNNYEFLLGTLYAAKDFE